MKTLNRKDLFLCTMDCNWNTVSTRQLLSDTGHNRLNVTVWRQKRKHFWQHLTYLRLLLLDTNANKTSFSAKQCVVSLSHTHHTSSPQKSMMWVAIRKKKKVNVVIHVQQAKYFRKIWTSTVPTIYPQTIICKEKKMYFRHIRLKVHEWINRDGQCFLVVSS